MKEILLETKIKNNRLHKLIFSKFESVSAFCLTINIPAQECYALINLRTSPYWIGGPRRGTPKPISQTIESALERPVEWIFPVELYLGVLNGAGISKQRTIARYEMGLDQARSMALGSCVTPVEVGLEERAEKSLFPAAVAGALNLLNDREKQVIKLRFGIGCDFPRTLDQTAAIFRVTRERVRQIESKAIRKLREPRANKVIREIL